MSGLIALTVVAGVLFVAAFFTKRRFGLLGLALAAGATLSSLWAGDVAVVVEQSGVRLLAPPLESVVAVVLTLLPATVLLFSGQKYKHKGQRVFGAFMFAALGLVFLLPALGQALVLEAEGKQVFDLLMQYRAWIITAGLVYAILDVLVTKLPKPDAP